MSTSTLSATRALARREFLRSIRSPAMTIQSVVFPAVLLMVLLAVFGTAVGDLDRQPYVQRIGPALIISGAAFGSLAAAVGLFVDRTTGMFSRLRTMPLSGRLGAASPVLARSISEHLRVAGVAVVITAVAAAFGFRFHNGFAPAIGFFAVAVVGGSCYCWIGFALAARATSQEAVVPAVSALFLVMLFVSRGMVPVDAFPNWVQPLVRVLPSSVMVHALQRLANGGPLVAPIIGAIAWTVAITVVFGALTLRSLSRQAHRSV